MLSQKELASIEMGAGALAICAGFFFLQLPPNWWPNMHSFLVHVGVSLGFGLLTCGAIAFLVGNSRSLQSHSWQDWIVATWDRARIRKGFYMKAIIIFILLVMIAAITWSALAQEPQGPITVDDRSKCPVGYLIIDSNVFTGVETAVRSPANAKVCLVKNEINRGKTGLDLR